MINSETTIIFLCIVIMAQQALWNIDKMRSADRRSKEIAELKAKQDEIEAQHAILLKKAEMIESRRANIIHNN